MGRRGGRDLEPAPVRADLLHRLGRAAGDPRHQPVRRQERRKPARRGDRSIPRSRLDKLSESESEDGTIIVIISPSSSRRAALNVAEALGASIMDAAAAPSRAPAVSTTGGVVDNHRPLHRQQRERSKDRKRGGQPGHRGKGLGRDPDPGERETAEPPAECRSCHGSLDGAETLDPRWAQVIDVQLLRKVTEVLLPGLACGGCGAVTYAAAPQGFHAGSVTYGPVLNAAAVLLSCYGNVPAERSAHLIGMLTGEDVSAGWIDKAVARMSARLQAGGFDEAMAAALAAEDVLAADETPVNVLDKTPSRTRAEALLRSAIARYGQESVRENSLYLSWLAEDYVQLGEIEHAAAIATQMAALAAHTKSVRTDARLRYLGGQLAPYRGTASVADFFDVYQSAATPGIPAPRLGD